MGCGPNPTGTGDETGSDGTGAESGSSAPTGESGSTGEPEGAAFEENNEEYEACGPSFCINLECGVDEVTSKYAAMIMAEIEDAGFVSSIRFTHMFNNPGTNQLTFQLESQVAWYRFWWGSWIRTTDPDEEVRADLRRVIENLAEGAATQVIARAEVMKQASACSGMVYSMCLNNTSQRSISIARQTGDACAGGQVDEFSINIESGESVCTINAPTTCG